MRNLRKRIRSMRQCFQLTGYPGGRFVPSRAKYSFNGVTMELQGQFLLSMMMNIIADDEYRLRGLKGIGSVADVGANIGVFALHVLSLFRNCNIHCYEPDSRNVPDLIYNLRGFRPVLYQEAVTGNIGTANLELLDDHTSSQLSSSSSSGTRLNKVDTIDLASLLTRFATPRVDLLKLDCEGSEYEILQQEAIKAFDMVVGELHITDQYQPDDAIRMLEERGFKLREVRRFEGGKAICVAVNSLR